MSFPLKPCDVYNNIAQTKVKKEKNNFIDFQVILWNTFAHMKFI
jgi:hypothetical protein